MAFPPELDVSIYQRFHKDLLGLSHAQLIKHWESFGLREGRTASKIQDRMSLLSLLQPCQSILEIGVFDSPSLEFLKGKGKTIHYADWLDKESLIRRAASMAGRHPEKVPDIRYVLSDGYDQISARYDAIVSHHCVEHQPNLVQHLINVQSKLNPGGFYLFSVPDKRRCFDHFIPESTILDVIEAFYDQRQKPPLKSVFEHRCFTRHDFMASADPYISASPEMRACLDNAFSEFLQNAYVDVHCWQFTPYGFKQLYNQLLSLGIVPSYRDFCIYCAGSEFYVALAF
jgi:SAM-dependent methyltransferase